MNKGDFQQSLISDLPFIESGSVEPSALQLQGYFAQLIDKLYQQSQNVLSTSSELQSASKLDVTVNQQPTTNNQQQSLMISAEVRNKLSYDPILSISR